MPGREYRGRQESFRTAIPRGELRESPEYSTGNPPRRRPPRARGRPAREMHSKPPMSEHRDLESADGPAPSALPRSANDALESRRRSDNRLAWLPWLHPWLRSSPRASKAQFQWSMAVVDEGSMRSACKHVVHGHSHALFDTGGPSRSLLSLDCISRHQKFRRIILARPSRRPNAPGRKAIQSTRSNDGFAPQRLL